LLLLLVQPFQFRSTSVDFSPNFTKSKP
jgi:hypothetical protein